MAAAYIEHRPHATSEHDKDSHYVIVVDGKDHGSFETQSAAKTSACKSGYSPIHVARERHLQDKKNPAHWRHDPC